jgi:hypothetical protein
VPLLDEGVRFGAKSADFSPKSLVRFFQFPFSTSGDRFDKWLRLVVELLLSPPATCALFLSDAAVQAHASHPDWVIRIAMHNATGIMNANQAGHYELAAEWLEKAALAYQVSGREGERKACLEKLIDRHRRKYKLRPLLEGLRGR